MSASQWIESSQIATILFKLAMTHSLGSAERPASESSDPNAVRPVQPAQYMTVDDSPPGGYSESHRLAFYNIGWDRKSKKEWHTADGLATEICDMVLDKGIDAVGICEVFNPVSYTHLRAHET